jgi:hypothetical protein
MTRSRITQFTLIVSVLALAWEASARAQTPTPTPTPLKFYAVTPCRVVDTRGPTGTNGGPSIQHGQTRTFTIKGNCGVPSTAGAAVLNVTIAGPTSGGFLTLWPAGGVKPFVSTINWPVGEIAIANGAIVPLASSVTLDLSVFEGGQAGQTDVVLDVTGYFQ